MSDKKKIQVLVVDSPDGHREALMRALSSGELGRDLHILDVTPENRAHLLPFVERPELPPLFILEPQMDQKPKPAPVEVLIPAHTFVGHEPSGDRAAEARTLNLVPVPSKSKTLRTLRKVIPTARFQCVTLNGIKSVQLFARVRAPNGRSSEQPVSNVEIPPNGSEEGACQALLCSVFREYGTETRWDPKFPGHYVLTPIKNFKGQEENLPAELDPDLNMDLDALGKLKADHEAGKLTVEEFQTAAAKLVAEAENKATVTGRLSVNAGPSALPRCDGGDCGNPCSVCGAAYGTRCGDGLPPPEGSGPCPGGVRRCACKPAVAEPEPTL